jgi:hypothetical protein
MGPKGPKYSCVSSGTGHPQDLNSIARYDIDSAECGVNRCLRDRGHTKTAMNFTVAVQDKDGKPANDLEPYMGHAAFVSNDLSVFAHVHPAGSVSMASLEPARGSTEVPAGMPMAKLVANVPLAPKVSFPYGFPRAGEYSIFVQIKRRGRVETGVFDALVE